MVIGSAVAYLFLSGRKEREWKEELELSRGLNIVRTFKDPDYNITPRTGRIPRSPLSTPLK